MGSDCASRIRNDRGISSFQPLRLSTSTFPAATSASPRRARPAVVFHEGGDDQRQYRRHHGRVGRPVGADASEQREVHPERQHRSRNREPQQAEDVARRRIDDEGAARDDRHGGVHRNSVDDAPCIGGKHRHPVVLDAGGKDVARGERQAAEEPERQSDERPEIAAAESNLAPPDLVPEHQRHAGEPDQRAECDAGPERLA